MAAVEADKVTWVCFLDVMNDDMATKAGNRRWEFLMDCEDHSWQMQIGRIGSSSELSNSDRAMNLPS